LSEAPLVDLDGLVEQPLAGSGLLEQVRLVQLRAQRGQGDVLAAVRTILSPAASNVAARPAGAGSAGAVDWAASRAQGLVTSDGHGRRDLAPDQRVGRFRTAPGEQEPHGGHEDGRPGGERACRVHDVPVSHAVAGRVGGRCRLVAAEAALTDRVHAFENQRQDDQRDADRAQQVDRGKAQVVARGLRTQVAPDRLEGVHPRVGQRDGRADGDVHPDGHGVHGDVVHRDGLGGRARMPSLDRLTPVPVIVVAASASIPVRPPLTCPPMICSAGREVADGVVLDPVGRHVLHDHAGGAGRGHQAVLAAAELDGC
jgi:hypothetical protein